MRRVIRPRRTTRTQITPEQVLAAYQQGYFPMSRGQYGPIDWFMAEPRTVIPLDERFHVRRSLRKIIQKTELELRLNTRFEQVIRHCARHGEVTEDEVWLSEEMIALYIELHRRGFAHSIEVFQENQMVGGLYGLALKSAFFGESMFSRVSSASQIALVALVERLRARGFKMLDAQMRTAHISHFGAQDYSHEEYLGVLAEAMLEDAAFV
ncbi:MAG: leucyl/phenylalanyl-tRNA--protein transferase [Acidobacteria bacterium]|nr:leucyl/phenylalanyl-tRNA--protein transferase [Acidobacteriota bacterium]